MRRRSVLILALVVGSLFPAGTFASSNSVGVKLTGPGMTKAGDSVAADLSVVNSSGAEGVLPDAITELRVDVSDLRIRPRAISACRATKPRDGDRLNCARASQIGSGRIRGFLGQPGGSNKEFGSLSRVSGRATMFNLGSRQGRALVAIEVVSDRPFRGASFSVTAKVNAKEELVVKVPKLAQLPRVVRRSYPASTQLILSRLTLRIDGGATQRGRTPYLSLRRPGVGSLGVGLTFSSAT